MTPTIDKMLIASPAVSAKGNYTAGRENERALAVVEKLMAVKNRTPEQSTLRCSGVF